MYFEQFKLKSIGEGNTHGMEQAMAMLTGEKDEGKYVKKKYICFGFRWICFIQA